MAVTPTAARGTDVASEGAFSPQRPNHAVLKAVEPLQLEEDKMEAANIQTIARQLYESQGAKAIA